MLTKNIFISLITFISSAHEKENENDKIELIHDKETPSNPKELESSSSLKFSIIFDNVFSLDNKNSNVGKEFDNTCPLSTESFSSNSPPRKRRKIPQNNINTTIQNNTFIKNDQISQKITENKNDENKFSTIDALFKKPGEEEILL